MLLLPGLIGRMGEWDLIRWFSGQMRFVRILARRLGKFDPTAIARSVECRMTWRSILRDRANRRSRSSAFFSFDVGQRI